MTWFKKLNLIVKVGGMMLLMFVLLLGAVTTVTNWGISDLTARTGRQRVEQQLNVIQGHFGRAGQEMVAATRFLAARPELGEAVARRKIAGLMDTILAGSAPQPFDALSIVDVRGELVDSTTRDSFAAGSSIAAGALPGDLIERALAGIATAGVVVETDSAASSGRGRLYLASAVALYDASGAVSGVLLATRRVDDGFLSAISLSQESHLALIADGGVLAHNLPAGQGELLTALRQEIANDHVVDGEIRVPELLRGAGGVSYALAYTPLELDKSGQVTLGVVAGLADLAVFRRQVLVRTAALFSVIALAAQGAIVLFARANVIVPIQRLQFAANRVMEGDYQQRIAVRSMDELGQSSAAFNAMSARLQSLIGSLEQQVAERTRVLERRSELLMATADVIGGSAAALGDQERLLARMATLIGEKLDAYHTAIYLLDGGAAWASLVAASGDAGRRLLAGSHRLAVGGESLVGTVAAQGTPRVVRDTLADAGSTGSLPDTRCAVALPLRVGGRIIGVLDVQSNEPTAFDEDDSLALQALADQVAMTISNARLFQQSQERLEAVQRAYGEYGREAWAKLAGRDIGRGYRYAVEHVSPAEGIWRPEMALAVERDHTVVEGPDPLDDASAGVAAVPIRIRDQIVGVVNARKHREGGRWSAEEVALLETLIDRLSQALDGARLYQQTQRREAEQRLIGDVTTEMRRTLDVDSVLQTAIREIGDALHLARVEVRMGSSEGQDGKGHT